MYNFKNIKVDDHIWHFRTGWGVVTEVRPGHDYPIVIRDSGYNLRSFTMDGKEYPSDMHPSIFPDPPVLYAEPKPCLFKRGDKVLVWGRNNVEYKRYFSHMAVSGDFMCYEGGRTEWSAEGAVTAWANCKGVNDENI